MARELRLEPSPASGQVAVYVDVLPRSDLAKFRMAIERSGDKLADVAELIPIEALTVDPDNAAGLAAELDQKLARLPSLFRTARSARACWRRCATASRSYKGAATGAAAR